MVVATMRPTTLQDFRANLSAFNNPLLTEVARRAAPQARIATPPPGTPIFTDDRARWSRLCINWCYSISWASD